MVHFLKHKEQFWPDALPVIAVTHTEDSRSQTHFTMCVSIAFTEGDHFPGKPRNGREFDGCLEKARDLSKSRGKILSGKTSLLTPRLGQHRVFISIMLA